MGMVVLCVVCGGVSNCGHGGTVCVVCGGVIKHGYGGDVQFYEQLLL